MALHGFSFCFTKIKLISFLITETTVPSYNSKMAACCSLLSKTYTLMTITANASDVALD